MDDSMADGIDWLHCADGGFQPVGVEARRRRLELAARQLGIVGADEADLERARAGVDDEDAHLLAGDLYQSGHTQSRMSGESSPNSRVYCRWRSRSSSMSWRTWAAFERSPGTRSITSMTRWKRSRSLSITMSKGVVVVPSSLYPRTWMLSWLVRRYVSRWMSHG